MGPTGSEVEPSQRARDAEQAGGNTGHKWGLRTPCDRPPAPPFLRWTQDRLWPGRGKKISALYPPAHSSTCIFEGHPQSPGKRGCAPFAFPRTHQPAVPTPLDTGKGPTRGFGAKALTQAVFPSSLPQRAYRGAARPNRAYLGVPLGPLWTPPTVRYKDKL